MNLILEFWGEFLAKPVTTKSSNLSLISNSKVLPIGSALPKYFSAISSVITAEFNSLSTVLGFPFIKGKEKTEKKLSSTQEAYS